MQHCFVSIYEMTALHLYDTGIFVTIVYTILTNACD